MSFHAKASTPSATPTRPSTRTTHQFSRTSRPTTARQASTRPSTTANAPKASARTWRRCQARGAPAGRIRERRRRERRSSTTFHRIRPLAPMLPRIASQRNLRVPQARGRRSIPGAALCAAALRPCGAPSQRRCYNRAASANGSAGRRDQEDRGSADPARLRAGHCGHRGVHAALPARAGRLRQGAVGAPLPPRHRPRGERRGRPALLAAVLAFFAWNFFFLPPYHTLDPGPQGLALAGRVPHRRRDRGHPDGAHARARGAGRGARAGRPRALNRFSAEPRVSDVHASDGADGAARDRRRCSERGRRPVRRRATTGCDRYCAAPPERCPTAACSSAPSGSTATSSRSACPEAGSGSLDSGSPSPAIRRPATAAACTYRSQPTRARPACSRRRPRRRARLQRGRARLVASLANLVAAFLERQNLQAARHQAEACARPTGSSRACSRPSRTSSRRPWPRSRRP